MGTHQVIITLFQIKNLDCNYLIKWNTESPVHSGADSLTDFFI